MAIAFDSANSGSGSAVSSLTVSVTTGAVSNALAIAMTARGGSGTSVTGVTFNGTAMTSAGSITNVFTAYIWYLALGTISAGSKDCIVSLDSTNGWIDAGVVVIAGADQSSPVDATQSLSTGGANPSLTITTVTDGAAICDCISTNASANLAMNAQTNRVSVYVDSPVSGQLDSAGGTRLITKSPAGDQILDWTQPAGGEETAIFAAAFKPAAAAAAADTAFAAPIFRSRMREW